MQVPADVKSKVEAKVAELKEVATKEDTAATKAKIEELQKEVLAIGQAMYGQPGAGQPGPDMGGAPGGAPGGDSSGGSGGSEGGVVDAEFTDSDK